MLNTLADINIFDNKKAFQISVIMISAAAAALSISNSHDNKTD